MISLVAQAVAQSSGKDVFHRFQAGLEILLEAYDYACELQRTTWDFAVEIQYLRAANLSNSDLRWLVCKGYVEHSAEMSRTGQDERAFHPTGTLTFGKRTCFVLTEKGALFARQENDTARRCNEAPHSPDASKTSQQIPEWDKERQELRVGGLVVKQFKVPAPNQEVILAAFQEEDWPPRIDDPLPPHPDQDAKRRLHDTITTLNRHQKHRLIRFSGDGSGEGIRWEYLLPPNDKDAWQ